MRIRGLQLDPGLGAGIGGVLAIVVAATLTGLRAEIPQVSVALILVLTVLVGALVGGRLDVLALLDRERVVGAGVEEVEAERGHERRHRSAEAASDERADEHDEHEHERHRHLGDLAAETGQGGGDDDGEHATEAGTETGVELQPAHAHEPI